MLASKLVWAFLLFCLPVMSMQAKASAHVEQINNGVSAVMHIYPDDSPVAGRPATIQFIFGGSRRAFTLQNCGCRLTVNNGTRDVASVDIDSVATSATVAKAVTTFPVEGVYGLSVAGFTGDSGQRFKLTYSVRVNPNGQKISTAVASGINVLLVSVASLVLLSMVAYSMITRNGRYIKHHRHKPTEISAVNKS